MLRFKARFLPVIVTLLLLVGANGPQLAVDAKGSSDTTQPDAARLLADSSWRLVRIISMDDSTFTPKARMRYTLEFGPAGEARIRADCNHASTTWESLRPGHLTFTEIVATRAQCPPGSLHDRYLSQFPWIRSYVMENGNLFLATLADGAIIEFERAPLVATVLGEEIRTSDPGEARQAVLSRLFNRYAESRKIRVDESEIDAFVARLEHSIRVDGSADLHEATEAEASQTSRVRRDLGRSIIRQWKLNRSLYKEYGGRLIFQQFGPEPLDAYRHYLEERRAEGDFEFHEEGFSAVFWHYFIDEAIHSFYEVGSEAETQAFELPPWAR